MEALLYVGIFFLLLFLGIVFGSLSERRHFNSLRRRETSMQHILQTQTKGFLMPDVSKGVPSMVCSETTVATDYFKRFLARLRGLFGGEIRSFDSLVERARRETLVKLLDQANSLGYNAICNVRLDPADIGGNVQPQGQSMVCIVGSATAYHSQHTLKPVKP